MSYEDDFKESQQSKTRRRVTMALVDAAHEVRGRTQAPLTPAEYDAQQTLAKRLTSTPDLAYNLSELAIQVVLADGQLPDGDNALRNKLIDNWSALAGYAPTGV